MIRRGVLRQIFRFCSKDKVQQKQSAFLTEAEKKFSNIPIHERPYDKEKYEVPSKKLKKNSGYALLQIEPFPRGRIMKICYHILHQVKIDIPEDATFRILVQEKTKYVMEMVDKQEDIEELERLLGFDRIQLFIMSLANQLELIKKFRVLKPWENIEANKNQIESQFVENFKKSEDIKFPAYKRPERPIQNII